MSNPSTIVCIRSEDFDPNIHIILSGPFQTNNCDNNCITTTAEPLYVCVVDKGGQAPTPSGPPDTHWLFPPAPQGTPISEIFWKRDILDENVVVCNPWIENIDKYTLLYIEQLKPEFGGDINAVWVKRSTPKLWPFGNMFSGDLIIQGIPVGVSFTSETDPRKDFLSGKTASIVNGVINTNNIRKISKAGGYIIEMIKYIGENELSGNGSTRLMGADLNAMDLIFHDQTASPSPITNLDSFNIPYYTN